LEILVLQKESVSQYRIKRFKPAFTLPDSFPARPLFWIIVGSSVIRLAIILGIYSTDPGSAYTSDSLRYLEPITGDNAAGLCRVFPAATTISLPQIPPLYAWLLCGLDSLLENLTPAVLIGQILLTAASTALVFHTALWMLNSQRAAIAAALLFAIDPLQTYYASTIMSETLFIFLITLTGYCGARLIGSLSDTNAGRWAIGFGLCIGLCMMTRLVAHHMLIPIVAGLLFFGCRHLQQAWQKVVRVALLVILPVVLITGSWQIRNGLATGSYAFSSASSHIILEWKAAGLLAVKGGISKEEALSILQQRNADAFATESEQLAQGWKIGVDYLMQNKTDYLLWSVADLGKILMGPAGAFAWSWAGIVSGTPTDSPQVQSGNAGVKDTIYQLLITYTFAGLILTYLLALAGLVHLRYLPAQNRVALLLLLGMAAFLILIATGHASAYSRFRAPAMPLLCVVAAAGFERWRQWRQSWQLRRQ
jgi:4-amino-4-deoxy-L-arabinose transferase-like glycosyltransferase